MTIRYRSLVPALALSVTTFLLTLPLRAADPPTLVPVPAPKAVAVPDVALPILTLTPTPAHKKIKVAVYKGPGASDGGAKAMAALNADPNIAAENVSVPDIVAGKLSGYSAVVMPGGSGGGQGKGLGEAGRDAVKKFVRGGGGYIGICGGSYLASVDYKWSLGILNAHVLDKAHWARGHGPVEVAPTADGKVKLGADVDKVTILYWQGPILAPASEPGMPAYDEWAKYTGEIAKKGAPHGVMPGTTAVAAAPFGEGQVVCFSPHPEKTAWQASMLQHALLWVTKTSADDRAKTTAR